MGLAIIFLLVTALAVWGVFRSLGGKNFFGMLMAGATTLVFGWFTVMTFIDVFTGGGSTGH
ncbi:DUF2759 domain-containing protein [Pseudalkalibacillus caeni]|uniref:DUF2759 domain-containing protein n=1 Tax=Exobacillus caeni TaxID=2574798 RepID=A0A5R9F764_9BACL|nr:DUF2759 domain-containing protein [Pseudalkalibacillus caeni]TLS36334.1 DUF2759 domain-containing protein [Pseudalkalibacillus caeni]